jgi:hypothetical protein
MALLTAAVIVVGVICLLDLALTVGVIRRLREHASLLATPLAGGALRDPIAAPGVIVGEFAAMTTDGTPVTRASLTGRTVVGFFSPSCAPCAQTVPKFTAYADDVCGGRDQVLAVVIGEPAAAARQVEALAPSARVVIEPLDGPVAQAFRVTGYPALAVVDEDHRIVASGTSMDHLLATT